MTINARPRGRALTDRRQFLRRALSSASLLALSPLAGCGGGNAGGADAPAPPAGGAPAPPPGTRSNLANVGPLQVQDANGLRLPAGFTSRVVAHAGARRPGAASGYVWHDAPDGGAVFASAGDGWIYVSNSEVDGGGGGVGALRFDNNAQLIDQYQICSGTSRNCAGGATPWGTWLTCEEVGSGRVWECSVDGSAGARVLPVLGSFNHEALAVDPLNRHLFMTEDTPSGAFFRFVPSNSDWPAGAARAALNSGTLQLLRIAGGGAFPPASGSTSTTYAVAWVDWPAGASRPAAASFNGGEGIWYHAGKVFFATKGDNRVWVHDTAAGTLRVLYDDTMPGGGALSGVDNVLGNAFGDLLVAEDGGNQEIVALTADGAVVPLLRVTGHSGSELTGPAFSPDGRRLYFSSQRGPGVNGGSGITYEVTGPFFIAA